MVAEATNLPSLSPQQSALLNALILADGDVLAPVRSGQCSLPELLAAHADPAVQAYLEQFRRLSVTAAEIRAAQAARTAINTLERILTSDPDPIEQRRAATTLLRTVSRLQQPAHEPRPPRPHPIENPSRPNDPLRPSPDQKPGDVAELVADFLCHQDSPAKLTSFFNYLAPAAQLEGEDVPEDLQDFLDEAPPIPLAPSSRIGVNDEALEDDRFYCTLILYHDHAPPTALGLGLTRADRGPSKGCWLVEDITIFHNYPSLPSRNPAAVSDTS